MGDQWKVVFEFYIKWYKNGHSRSILLRCATVHYPSTKQLKYSNCTVNPSKCLGRMNCTSINLMEAHLILPKTFEGIWRHSSILNSLLKSESDTIINTCDLMQNLNQTQIFYKLGQTSLTRMTQIIQMTQPSFIPDTTLRCICMKSYKFRQNASCSYAQFHYNQ